MGKVVYLTGAPASGKSTVSNQLAETVSGLMVFSYSALLRDHLNRTQVKSISEVLIRQKSASIITREDVEAVDYWLINEIKTKRDSLHCVIDSHPVTKENYGFRVTAFNPEQLSQLAPDVVICLYVSPEVTRQRIIRNNEGRPLPSDFEITMHNQLQTSLAAQYAFHLGKPCFLIDSSGSIESIIETVIDKAGFCRN